MMDLLKARFFLLVISGAVFGISCSGESTTSTTYENSDGQADLNQIDWEAEGAKPNGLTKKTLPKVELPPGGFYESLTVEPPSAQQGGDVRCTFDGSEPTTASAPMDSAYMVNSSTVLRCYEFVKDSVVARSTETYFVGEDVSMPVVAVSVPPYYLEEYIKGEPCKPDPCKSAKFWEDLDVPAHVEYYPEGSNTKEKAFEIDMEASIMGGYSRNQKKKSLSFKMKKKYQAGHFRYPLFDTRPTHKKFKGFILRNNGNRFVSDYIEDAMATSLLEGTRVDYQRSRQVVVFYNGQYYGIHDLREKLNEHFVETNYGIDADGVDFIKHTSTTVEVSNGSSESYLNLLSYIHDTDMSGDDAYQTVQEMMDVASYADYMAAEIYYHNGDWPNNNVRAWRSATQPWKFVAFDIDHGFDWTWGAGTFGQNTNMFQWISEGGAGSCSGSGEALCFHNVFAKMLANSDFKRTFINRAALLYSSFVNSGRVNEAVYRMVSTMPVTEIQRDMNKFPRRELFYRNACGGGFEYDGYCLMQWASQRDLVIRNEFRVQFGLGEDVTVQFVSEGGGRILLDDEELPSSNYSGTFFAGHPMKLTAKGEGEFVNWEDGSRENPRWVTPAAGAVYSATFK